MPDYPRLRPLIRAPRIGARVQQLGKALSRHYAGTDPLAVILLDGAATFAADLLRCTCIPGLRCHYMRAASYHGSRASSGEVTLRDLPPCDGRDILLIDDILDSGHTLARVQEALSAAGAKSITSCVLLDKPLGRQRAMHADFVGFTVPNVFLVGYGLDLDGQLRQLPDICHLHEVPTPVHPAPGPGPKSL